MTLAAVKIEFDCLFLLFTIHQKGIAYLKGWNNTICWFWTSIIRIAESFGINNFISLNINICIHSFELSCLNLLENLPEWCSHLAFRFQHKRAFRLRILEVSWILSLLFDLFIDLIHWNSRNLFKHVCILNFLNSFGWTDPLLSKQVHYSFLAL